MHDIVNIPAVQIMIGTLPIIVLLALTLLDQKRQFADIRNKIDAMDIRLSGKIDDLSQRVAKIEGKIEGHHVVLES